MSAAPSPYRIRVAAKRDIEPIMGLLDEAIKWLSDLDLDQWQGKRDRQLEHLQIDVVWMTVFVVEHLGELVATITVDNQPDADFWTHDDDPENALYIHRMAVTRTFAGIGLGTAMLDWAAGKAQRRGRAWLRLDAWRTNEKLHGYYKNLGFDMVRNKAVEGRGSGALFERPAADRHGGGPVLEDTFGLPAIAPMVIHADHSGVDPMPSMTA